MRRALSVLGLVAIAVFANIGSLPTGPRTAVAEPEVTCGWCNEVMVSGGHWHHGFNDTNGDLCGDPNPFSGLPGYTYCARCGGTSTCHTLWGEGEGRCHLACGGEAVAPFKPAIEKSIETGDVTELFARLSELDSEFEVRYNLAAGRIDIIAACDPTVSAATFVVPIGLRRDLGSLLDSQSSTRT
jgi:hypothetical protein